MGVRDDSRLDLFAIFFHQNKKKEQAKGEKATSSQHVSLS